MLRPLIGDERPVLFQHRVFLFKTLWRGIHFKEAVMFDSLVVQWGSLLGFAAVIAVVINLLKLAGVVKDDTAQIWSAALNLAGLAGLLLVKVFQPEVDIPGLDQQAAEFANVMTVMVAYISQLLSSKLTHYAIRGIPFFGVSNSHVLDTNQ